MLDNIKTSFSISDLEALTGISVHTIRMWERRYQLVEPLRTESNIRRYTNEHLKKLLNVSILLDAGHKISEVSDFSDHEITTAVNAALSQISDFKHEINEMTLAMLDFDSRTFENTYQRLQSSMPFFELFVKVMIPFLEHIGTLWQTNTITVAHEHYVSNILRQKLFYQIEHLPKTILTPSTRYILFLPLHELHEIGLLLIHYTLLMTGKDSIYLGSNVDIASLKDIPPKPSRVFISYMTIIPADENMDDYLDNFKSELLKPSDRLWVTGARIRTMEAKPTGKYVTCFDHVHQLLEHLT